jgi:hypothetical protein
MSRRTGSKLAFSIGSERNGQSPGNKNVCIVPASPSLESYEQNMQEGIKPSTKPHKTDCSGMSRILWDITQGYSNAAGRAIIARQDVRSPNTQIA